MCGAAAVLALAGVLKGGVVLSQEAEPTPEPTPELTPTPAARVRVPENTINIALLGIDTRPDRNFRNTDVIMIASVNLDTSAVALISIPRDTPVHVPNFGTYKINTIYAAGGPDGFKRMMLYNFGLRIDHYVVVNFSAVVKAVDALGGVDIIATCPLDHTFPRDPYYMGGPILAQDHVDYFTGEVWPAGSPVPTLRIYIPKPGIYTLNGLQALAYARARYGVPGGDFDRGRREQRLLRAMLAKARQLEPVSTATRLYQAVKSEVETDLSFESLLKLGMAAARLGDTTVRSYYLMSEDFNGAALNNNTPLARGSWSGFIQRVLNVSLNRRTAEPIRVLVLNGTSDVGFAVAAADRLRELGFEIADLRPASQPSERTLILDHSTNPKGSPINLLRRALNLDQSQIVKTPGEGDVYLTVIVGPDFNTCYYARTLKDTGSAPIEASSVDAREPPLKPFAPSDANPPQSLKESWSSPGLPLELTQGGGVEGFGVIPVSASSLISFAVPAGKTVAAHSAPSTRAYVLRRLPQGFTATIEGRSVDGQWLQFTLPRDTRKAWVRADAVEMLTPQPSPTPESDSAITASPSPDVNLEATPPAASLTNALTPQPMPIQTATPAPQEMSPSLVRVLGNGGVNLRAEPSLKGAVLAVLRPGTQYPVLAQDASGDWVQVKAGDQIGWVNRAVAQIITPPPLPSQVQIPPARTVNLRAAPSLSAAVLAVLQGGSQYAVLSQDASGEWLQIQAEGNTGWINRAVVIVTPN